MRKGHAHKLAGERKAWFLKMERTAAIILAAGQGKRMNSRVAKQYMLLEGKPVLYYALKVFEDSFVDEIVLVTGQGEEEYCKTKIVEKYGFHKVKKIVAGGKERYHSVYNGLCALADVKYVFIHDGARPFITEEVLNRALEEVKEEAACAVGVPVTDTIKIADEHGFVAQTPDRAHLWSMQTPQAFEHRLIKNAYEILIHNEERFLAEGIQITDDAMVAEIVLKLPVKIVEGSYDNIKITTPEDLARAEILCKRRKNG